MRTEVAGGPGFVPVDDALGGVKFDYILCADVWSICAIRRRSEES